MGWSRRIAVVAAVGVVGSGLVVAAANAVVLVRSGDRIATEPAALPHAQVAIVPGSRVLPNGELGAVVEQRVEAAIGLYDAGVVDKLLLSGDNRTHDYNEPDAMRDAVLAAGVPSADVFTDYAGYDTWHTMARASEVFEVRSAIVVTQDFHAARAVDLGRAAGIDVHALAVGDASGWAERREVLARVTGLAEATVRPDVVLGPELPITGDGRESWAAPATP